MTRLRSAITDEVFLNQIFKIGLLAEFESLLSCYSDEMGMLEDMVVAVNDLSLVHFKIVQEKGPNDNLPFIEGER